MDDTTFWWYVARSSGMVALVVLMATVVWGALLSGRLVNRPGAPRWLTDLHRYLGGLSCAITALHLAALVADSYSHFAWVEILVPFGSSWKSGAVAWGVVAMYIVVIVEVTSVYQRRISRKVWRAIHMSSYGSFWMALIHGATAGTDASANWYRIGVLVGVIVTTWAVVARILGRAGSPKRRTRQSLPVS
ncbi:MAG: ferric reductase-like transmembrane domain-containing protein [Acidimicrobiia bacterium]